MDEVGNEVGCDALREAAIDLFDNRLGWTGGMAPYAPIEFSGNLVEAIYGADDPRVEALRLKLALT